MHPIQEAAFDFVFVLRSRRKPELVRSARNDGSTSGGFVVLRFNAVPENDRFTMLVRRDNSPEQVIFENVPFEDLGRQLDSQGDLLAATDTTNEDDTSREEDEVESGVA